jgi:energy-coupling factor transporter ATP-binding protein EcfA2
MLQSLELKHFTAFDAAQLQFAPGLNVIIGENGTGKTHLLKVAYAALDVCRRQRESSDRPTKTGLANQVAAKLQAVLRPDQLGRLVRRSNRPGRQRAEIKLTVHENGQLAYAFNTSSRHEVVIDKVPSAWLEKPPVYLPTRELLSIYPHFVSLYETSSLEFDETWRDTCLLLGAPLARGPRLPRIKQLLAPLEAAMGGSIELTPGGRFYLNTEGASVEMHLVAEGLRKLAMIARLIATGALLDQGTLFWDEPEANLNPAVIKLVARTILHLCQAGIQVFVATHSLFLLREFDILLRDSEFEKIQSQFVGVQSSNNGVTIHQGPTVTDAGDLTVLQEELQQSDRYLKLEATE